MGLSDRAVVEDGFEWAGAVSYVDVPVELMLSRWASDIGDQTDSS